MKRALAFALLLCVIAPATAQQPAAPDIDAGAVFVAATPKLDGRLYQRAVMIVAPLPRGGHVGVVLNRPMQIQLAMLFPEDVPSREVRDQVYWGGAASRDVLFAIARVAPVPAQGSLELVPGVWLVGTEAAIDRLIETAPNEARYYMGLVGWAPGLLAEQIRDGSLALASADAAELFLADTSGLYDQVMRRAGARPGGARWRIEARAR
jgi:putative transcriptional regulator